MTNISPAAQAVLDAYRSTHLSINNLAAALRAAADQVVPESCFESDDAIRAALLAIAAELEGNA